MRPLVYLLLVGVACLLLRGAFLARPVCAVPARTEAGECGRYRQSLLPGEFRTFVLDMAGHSRLNVRFLGAGLGLRVEEAEGDRLRCRRLEDLPSIGRSWRSLLNPGDAPRTVRLTVHRAGAAHREVRHRTSGAGEPLEAGSFDLELVRAGLP